LQNINNNKKKNVLGVVSALVLVGFIGFDFVGWLVVPMCTWGRITLFNKTFLTYQKNV